MLREFGALPTEARARDMRERDYVWCVANLLLDREEELDALCPACRARVEAQACPVCGAAKESGEGGVNPSFDRERFERMKRGEGHD